MKKPNIRWLVLSFICILVGMVLLVCQLKTAPDGGFHMQMYGYGRYHHPEISSGNYIGMAAFLLMAGGVCGIVMAFRKGPSASGKMQLPKPGCILLSGGLIAVGCVLCYLSFVKGIRLGRRASSDIAGLVFLLLGCLVFYRGMQGKEYRFWEKKWEPLGEEKKTAEEKDIPCPHCGNPISRKEKYCPVCGRKI